MTEPELDEVIHIMLEDFRMGLLLGERYGLKVAVRAEKKKLRKVGFNYFRPLDIQAMRVTF
jgi:hypothetical protein